MGYIYKVTNKIDNKVYIGQTCRDPKKRWIEHYSRDINKDTYFHRALKKYGKDNFLWEVIEQCEDDVLNEREIYWIKYYDSYYKNNKGYNMTYGGEYETHREKAIIGVSPYEEEYIFKSAAEAERVLSSMYNDIFSHTHISQVCNGKRKSHKGWSFYFSDENGEKIIPQYEGQRGRKNKPIISIKIDTLEQKTYPSAAEASRQLGVDKSSISKCLRGLKPQANGYKFVYYEREEENGIKDC